MEKSEQIEYIINSVNRGGMTQEEADALLKAIAQKEIEGTKEEPKKTSGEINREHVATNNRESSLRDKARYLYSIVNNLGNPIMTFENLNGMQGYEIESLYDTYKNSNAQTRKLSEEELRNFNANFKNQYKEERETEKKAQAEATENKPIVETAAAPQLENQNEQTTTKENEDKENEIEKIVNEVLNKDNERNEEQPESADASDSSEPVEEEQDEVTEDGEEPYVDTTPEAPRRISFIERVKGFSKKALPYGLVAAAAALGIIAVAAGVPVVQLIAQAGAMGGAVAAYNQFNKGRKGK